MDDRDEGVQPHVLFYLERTIQDATLNRDDSRRIISQRMLYVDMDASGNVNHIHYAPYLDYRPLKEGEPGVESLLDRPECQWIDKELEHKAQSYAIAQVVPEHLAEVKGRKLELISKTEAAVKDRLTKEINYWDHRTEELKLQESSAFQLVAFHMAQQQTRRRCVEKKGGLIGGSVNQYVK